MMDVAKGRNDNNETVDNESHNFKGWHREQQSVKLHFTMCRAWRRKKSLLVRDRRNRACHEPLHPNKTTDPEACDFDRSVELHQAGARAARAGDLGTDKKKVAAACTLDRRCMRCCCAVPPPGDLEAENCMLDVKLLQTLLRPGEADVAQPVLHVLADLHVAAGDCNCHQALTRGVMRQTAKLLKILDDNPSMEGAPTVLEGCLNRPMLHFRRADACHAMENMKKCIKEETAALKLNSNLTLTRASRVEVCCSMNWKEQKQRFQECKRVVDESHPDARHLTRVHGWMPALALGNPTIDTCTDACMLKEKMVRHSSRMRNLHGEIKEQQQSNADVETNVRQMFVHAAERLMQPEFLDATPKESQMEEKVLLHALRKA
jgi:hypothetical protein